MKKTLLTLALFAVAGFGAWRYLTVQAKDDLPMAPVRQGEFSVIIRCRGELKARTSVQIVAPVNVPELRLVWLAPTGAAIKAGDPVVRFDPSSAQQQLTEKEAALKQAQAALDQAVAEAALATEQDRVETTQSKFTVEKAKLEVSKQEIVSRLQGEEAQVDLGLAEKKHEVQEAKNNFNQVSNEAKVASLKRQRDKAADEVTLTKSRLGRMQVNAPLTGVVVYLPNYSQGWMNAKPFKVGDQVWPGGVIAEIPDLTTLEMEGKVEEIDRGKIRVDQDVRIRVDALPESTFNAKLTRLSPLTEMGFEWPPTRSFRGFGHIANPDPRLRPGMNGRMDVILERLPDALSVPAKAVFTRQGKPIVYVAQPAGGYRATEVEVLARNPDEVAIKGVTAGMKVALAEPIVDAKQQGPS
jgi:HlyD family secretion protein